MTDLGVLERKLERQIQARKQAEAILEEKAKQLFDANQELKKLNDSLEEKIRIRTADLSMAKVVAERAQKAEQLFLASMSHEMRTPLNAIVGMANLMTDTSLTKDQTEYLDILLSSANLLQALIADVLDITKIDAGKIDVQSKPINLREILNSVEKTFQVKLDNKPVKLQVEIEPQINPLLLGDAVMINQILINLVGNAEKFTKEGLIKIKLDLTKETDEKQTIKFQIEDTGVGIEESRQELIFEEFKQADASVRVEFGGTGLGLAITQKLVNLMGGEVALKSQIGEGSTFYFELELEKTADSLSGYKGIFSFDFDFESMENKVLVVEDNVMNQKYISKLLEKWKLDFDIANNGEEAVALCNKTSYNLIFMDIQMPKMNGNDATRIIREGSKRNKETPIIALSASTFLSIKNEALENGMTDYLSKPFSPQQLGAVITKHKNTKHSFSTTDKVLADNSSEQKLDEAYIHENYSDDLEYAKDIFETFLDIAPGEIAKLNAAHKALDYEQIYQVAHKIKPSFTMVGLEVVSKLLEEIEKAAKAKDSLGLEEHMTTFSSSVDGHLSLVSAELKNINLKLA